MQFQPSLGYRGSGDDNFLDSLSLLCYLSPTSKDKTPYKLKRLTRKPGCWDQTCMLLLVWEVEASMNLSAAPC